MLRPAEPLGLKRSFGFGDRLGVATPGHLEALGTRSFAPVFAQQSIRELARTGRTPEAVMGAARGALERAGWRRPWGADGDHLQTPEDVARVAAAGFCFFTIDPSKFVRDDADTMGEAELDAAIPGMAAQGLLESATLWEAYRGTRHEVDDGLVIGFDDVLPLKRAAVKYGGALTHVGRMSEAVARASELRPYELEVSVDETRSPTTPLEHLFIGLELRRMGVQVVSLAPRFVGSFEKGVDYKGDLGEFERQYRAHVAIARHCGPYKLSIHSGSDKFSIYPVIGRLSGEHLHVKTAGTSYLEALRVASRVDRPFFRDLIAFCRGRYDADKASYHVSAVLADVPDRVGDDELEKWYLDHPSGRQILHVTFGAVLLGGKSADGAAFKDRLLALLVKHADLYREVLHAHIGKHLRLLDAG